MPSCVSAAFRAMTAEEREGAFATAYTQLVHPLQPLITWVGYVRELEA